jgi:hypothetical protein
MINLLLHQRFLFLKLRDSLLLVACNLLGLLVILVFLRLEFVFEFLHLLLQLVINIVVVSFFLCFEFFQGF